MFDVSREQALLQTFAFAPLDVRYVKITVFR